MMLSGDGRNPCEIGNPLSQDLSISYCYDAKLDQWLYRVAHVNSRFPSYRTRHFVYARFHPDSRQIEARK